MGLYDLTDGGNSSDDLAQFQLVENGGLPCGVQTHHENSHLFLAKEGLEKTLKRTHGRSPSLPNSFLKEGLSLSSLRPKDL